MNKMTWNKIIPGKDIPTDQKIIAYNKDTGTSDIIWYQDASGSWTVKCNQCFDSMEFPGKKYTHWSPINPPE